MTTYIAHFTPEAWINNQAIEVDAEGPREWDCTAYHWHHMPYLTKLEWEVDPLSGLHSAIDNDDVFKSDPAAPAWVRDWRGPFTIRISEAATVEQEQDRIERAVAEAEADPYRGPSLRGQR